MLLQSHNGHNSYCLPDTYILYFPGKLICRYILSGVTLIKCEIYWFCSSSLLSFWFLAFLLRENLLGTFF